jgi:hypothetical protein
MSRHIPRRFTVLVPLVALDDAHPLGRGRYYDATFGTGRAADRERATTHEGAAKWDAARRDYRTHRAGYDADAVGTEGFPEWWPQDCPWV